jgi:hypothetical protein
MCRKALQGICVDKKAKSANLAAGLRDLRDNGLIDKNLYDWADALRLFGNDAAHDINVVISPQDAKDIVEFTEAILEYVYTFRQKFNEFMERRNNPPQPPASLPDAPMPNEGTNIPF